MPTLGHWWQSVWLAFGILWACVSDLYHYLFAVFPFFKWQSFSMTDRLYWDQMDDKESDVQGNWSHTMKLGLSFHTVNPIVEPMVTWFDACPFPYEKLRETQRWHLRSQCRRVNGLFHLRKEKFQGTVKLQMGNKQLPWHRLNPVANKMALTGSNLVQKDRKLVQQTDEDHLTFWQYKVKSM